MTPKLFDLAVVGGGPAGAATALVAARQGLGVVVLESCATARWKPGETLAPACNPILDRLGIAAHLQARPELAVRSAGVRSLWGSSSPDYVDGFADPRGAGWIVDRASFETLLSELAIGAGAQWVWGARISVARRDADAWTLRVATDELNTIHAAIIVDATGRAAAIARRLGAKRNVYDALIAGVIAYRGGGSNDLAWTSVEAVDDGWWYAARGPNRLNTLARLRDTRDWQGKRDSCCTNPPADTLMLHQFIALSETQKSLHEMVVAAGSTALDRCAGDAWLAVGDAAAAFDPISSQGFPNALASGEVAALAAVGLLGRDRRAADAYAARMEATVAAYRRKLSFHYAHERRWPDAAFWRVRRDPQQAASAIGA